MKKQLLKTAIAVLLPFIVTNVNAQNITINSSVDSVYVSDDFSSGSSTLVGSGSGIGWSGNWLSNQGTGIHVNTSSSLSYPSGSFFSSAGGYAYTNAGETGISNKRLLTNGINLGGSTTFYVSFLAQKSASGAIRIDGQRSSDGLSRFGLGIETDGKLTVQAASQTVTSSTSLFENDKTYLVVARWDYVNSQADLKMVLFEEGDTIPTTDVGLNWSHTDGTATGSTGVVLQQFNFAFSAGEAKIDEFKLGSTWNSVTQAEPIIISASSGNNGTIEPSGTVSVFHNSDQTFTFTADNGYVVDDVLVNGLSVGNVTSYTLSNIVDNQSVSVTYREVVDFVEVEPQADAYVRGGTQANNNFGSDTVLNVKTDIDSDSNTRESYLRFDLPDTLMSVLSAKLRIKLSSINGASTSHAVSFVSDDTWDESTITWNNKPVEGTLLDSESSLIEGTWIEFDVTNQVENERNGDGEISFLVTETGTVKRLGSYFSKEADATNRPVLAIIVDDHPSGIYLEAPAIGSTLYQTIPHFSWVHQPSSALEGTYEIMIDNDSDFSSPVDMDTIPSFINYYSPDFEMDYDLDYYWKVRFVDENGSSEGWSMAYSFTISAPEVVVDVLASDGWDEIRTKWQTVLTTSETTTGAVELRFPENAVLNVQQDPNSDELDRSNGFLLYADGYDNVLVNGRGSKIILEATHGEWICGFMEVYNSSGMQVKDIIIDYHPNSLYQIGGVIQNFDKVARTFEVIVDTSVYQTYDALKHYTEGYFLSQEHQQKVGLKGVDFQMEESWEQAKVNDTTFQFTCGTSEYGRYRDEVENGDYFGLSHRAGDILYLDIGVDNFVVNNMTTHACRGRFFSISAGSKNIRSINNQYLRTQNRIMGSSSGGVGADRGDNMWYEGNRYEYSRDDMFHNGSNAGKGSVFRRNELIGAYRNSVWVQADRTWVADNTIEYAGKSGIHIGYAPSNPGTLPDVVLVEGNTIIRSNWNGIEVDTDTSNPDFETGSIYSENLIIRDNHIIDNYRNEAISIEYAKNVVLENNIISNTINNWSVFSEDELEIGISISNSENVTGTGNQMSDTRVLPTNTLFVDSNSQDVDVTISFDVSMEPVLSVEADAYVRNGKPTSNYGSDATMVVKTDASSSSFDRQSYLRFNLSNYYDTITSAILRVKLKSLNGASTTNNVKFVSDDSWGESTITWTNKPTAGITLNTQTVDTEGWIEYDVTNQVETERLGDGKVSFVISDTTTTKLLATYHTKEAVSADDRPYLLINEPSSGARMVSTVTELNQSNVKLYPNPANGEFYIMTPQSISETMHLQLFDLSGRTVLSKTINAQEGTNSIDISTIEKGLYVVRLNSNTFNYVGKLKVQ